MISCSTVIQGFPWMGDRFLFECTFLVCSSNCVSSEKTFYLCTCTSISNTANICLVVMAIHNCFQNQTMLKVWWFWYLHSMVYLVFGRVYFVSVWTLLWTVVWSGLVSKSKGRSNGIDAELGLSSSDHNWYFLSNVTLKTTGLILNSNLQINLKLVWSSIEQMWHWKKQAWSQIHRYYHLHHLQSVDAISFMQA